MDMSCYITEHANTNSSWIDLKAAFSYYWRRDVRHVCGKDKHACG